MKHLLGLLIITSFSCLAAEPPALCKDLLSPEHYRYTFRPVENSLKDLEPVFKRMLSGERYEIVIPKTSKLNLIPENYQWTGEYLDEKDIDFFPYHLKKAKTEEEEYFYARVFEIYQILKAAQFAENTGRDRLMGLESSFKKFRFAASPLSGKSNLFYRNPERLFKTIGSMKRFGNPPFGFINEQGDMVLSNEHFLRYLKRTGTRSLKLHRGQSDFDHFFYGLLLKKDADRKMLRIEFAKWLAENEKEFLRTRRIPPERLNEWISKLKNKSIPDMDILTEMAREVTSLVIYTSATRRHSAFWSAPGSSPFSEVIELKLDLQKLPDWYLDDIVVGADLETEIDFPFATRRQMEALREALIIK